MLPHLRILRHLLLRHLLANQGRVLSKTQLLDAVWGFDFGGDGPTLAEAVEAAAEAESDIARGVVPASDPEAAG